MSPDTARSMTPIEYLFSLEIHGIKLGLNNIRHLLRSVGNPQHAFRSVHVGGTNGKGSVVSYIGSVLVSAGYSVGKYTSPHMADFSERIVVDGERIPREDLERLIDLLRPVADEMPSVDNLDTPTFFEMSTAVAFKYFAERRVDFGVIEVGMGGRLDSTNVLQPEVTVITNVDMEHREHLGDTIEKIAFEKIGIITDGAAVVSAIRQPSAVALLEERCKEKAANLYLLDKNFSYELKPLEFPRQALSVRSALGNVEGVEISLAGEHQGQNGAVAVVAAQVLAGTHTAITEDAIRSGMAATRWPCRLELVSRKPLIVVDVAHNAAGARRLQAEVSRAFADKRVILVLAISNDKDADAIASILCPDAEVTIVTQFRMHRHMPAEQLYNAVRRSGHQAMLSYSVAEAVQKARSIASDDTLILITGSLFTAGEAKQALKPLVSADDSLG